MAEKQAILVPDYLTVRELAELIDASPIDVMKKLIANGIMASINQQIDYDTASLIIEEMGFEAQSALNWKLRKSARKPQNRKHGGRSMPKRKKKTLTAVPRL